MTLHMRSQRRWSAALLCATTVLACGRGSEDVADEPAPAPAPEVAAPVADGGPHLRFTDVSAQSGITLRNVSGDPQRKFAIPETIGQGAAALDYDGDGRLDLFVVNGDTYPGYEPDTTTRCALYANRGGMRFENVTQAVGLDFEAWGHGANAVDFDADGDADLYVTVLDGPNRFYENTDGSFALADWGGADEGPSTASAFFDADGDGDLDLYVGSYVVYDPENPPNDGKPCEWKGLSVGCGPKGTTPGADHFYENRDGRLVEATAAFGFVAVQPSYTLGVVTGDLDGDGDIDLYVANDSEANCLFENLGDGHFREAAMVFGVDLNEDGRPQAGMGVECADFDNDGLFDLFVTNFSHDSNSLYNAFRTPAGKIMFDDATYSMDLGRSSYDRLSWGVRAVDLDHDGWLDLVVVSGHVYPQVDDAPIGSSYRQKNQVFENLGPQGENPIRFRELVLAPGDAFEAEKVSRGLVAADLDNDGDVDFLVVEMDEAPTLIRNDSRRRGHWIGFELADDDVVIGARVEVVDANGIVRWRERASGAGFLSSGDPRLHFGLGDAPGPVARVRVRWPSGASDEYEGLAVDRYWRLEAGGAAPRALELP